MTITKDILYVGVDDHILDLFEGQYEVPLGMAYNSYVILDDKIAVMDAVDQKFGDQWLANIEKVLGGCKPDYLIVQHMEPDHSANILSFTAKYPDATVVSNAKSFAMMKNFYGTDFTGKSLPVTEGAKLELGKHVLNFVTAPMVHWPEVIMTYDSTDKVLFSADAFGKFGANDVEDPEGWDCEARRYYFGIVGKYGAQVQPVLKKAAALDIQTICPLHGPVLTEDLGHYIGLYNTWSSYEAETEGVFIAYASIYGHTAEAAKLLAEKLKEKGCPKVAISDLAREDMHECIENAFRYGKLVLASSTYNADLFPVMKSFIDHLTARYYQKRTIGIIENGSWAPQAGKVMRRMFEGSKEITFTENSVKILSALNDASRAQLEALADELCAEYK